MCITEHTSILPHNKYPMNFQKLKTFLNNKKAVVNITVSLIIITASVLVVWDIAVAINDVKYDTISRIIQGWSFAFPAIPLIWGILGGHWFWSRDVGIFDEYSFYVLGVIFLLSLIFNPYLAKLLPTPVWCAIGFVLGHLLWPMNIPPT